MKFTRDSRLLLIVGGTIAAAVAGIWVSIVWEFPAWVFLLVAIPFTLAAAFFYRRALYLGVLGTFVVADLATDVFIQHSLSDWFMPDTINWIVLASASEIICLTANHRDRVEQLSRRRTRELEAMGQTLAEISQELELNRLLEAIVERAAKLLNASLSEMALYNPASSQLEIVAHYPKVRGQIGVRMNLGQGAMGTVAQTKKPLILNDYLSFQRAMPASITTGLNATLDVPLLRGRELIGVLGVGHHQPAPKFTRDDERLLTIFARQATVAIVNARLYADTQLAARTDGLTGLNNRRHLFEIAGTEYERARRYHRPFSILILDVDHFKQVNDRYGHRVGDQVLHSIARQCLASLRTTDVIGRYGGEEFAILLPETELASALDVAKRLRAFIADHATHTARGDVASTISIGISEMKHSDRTTLDKLFEQADDALFKAKNAGRNRISIWDRGGKKPVLVRK